MKILINENQLKAIIKEAIPYSVAKPYLKLKRKPKAIETIAKVFGNIKNLPDAKVLDRKGDRISFPYGEESVADRIEELLSKYDYTIKDFDNNISFSNTKPNQDIKITKALSTISNKEPEASELITLYSTARSQGVTKKDDLIIVFSKHPYDIAGMSYDRNWKSCMKLTTGDKREFVKIDIENGTIIVYLATKEDTNIKNPLGRLLIKPYADDENNIVLYPEAKTYGQIDDPDRFLNYVNDIMKKVQDTPSTTYNLLSCLYRDGRTKVRSKEAAREHSLEIINYNEKYPDGFEEIDLFDIQNLTKEEHRMYVLGKIKFIEQSKFRFVRFFELNLSEIKLLTKEEQKKYVLNKLKFNKENTSGFFFYVSKYEMKYLTKEQIETYQLDKAKYLKDVESLLKSLEAY